MNMRTITGCGRRAALAGVVTATMVMGGSLGFATSAAAVPPVESPDLALSPDLTVAAPPAIPGVPDVGEAGEVAGQQLVPTIDPYGNPVWPIGEADVPGSRDVLVRSGWTEVVAVVDGARIRTTPVTGTVVGLISKGAYFYINCQVRAADGYVWGYATHNRRYGWVRRDLWEIVRYTAPNAPAPRPIPWC